VALRRTCRCTEFHRVKTQICVTRPQCVKNVYHLTDEVINCNYKKWDPKRIKAAIEAMKKEEMCGYKASRVFNVPHTTQHNRVMLKTDRKAQVKQ